MSQDEQSEMKQQGDKPSESASISEPTAAAGEEEEGDAWLPGRREVRLGSKPGSVRIRIVLPKNPPLRRVRRGVLEATEAANEPSSGASLAIYRFKHFLIGEPIASARAENERLSKFKALAVLSSDAISSVAYATEAILINLVAAGSSHLGLTLPISLVIIALLCIVAISYRQTIPAYPNGGGSYIVARENLGTLPGLVAAAALLIDYTLNVAVSISAGVQNLASLFSGLSPYVVPIGVALVIIMAVINLRGVRESGAIFSFPTYFFIVSAYLLIIVGLFNAFVFHHQPVIGAYAPVTAIEPLSLFLILRSFATGCSAMTGVEAISNGIPAFKKPETHNAATTLTWMAVILGTLFLGISLLATTYHVEANAAGNPTVIAQIATQVFSGPLSFMYPVFQLATLGILTLSAETSYSDFPRLASLLAHDNFLPHLFGLRGDRLSFSTGIIFLSIIACTLLIIFKGSTVALINLFAVGVFVAFTLSQSGMVRHWWRLRTQQRGWLHRIMINGLGAVTTSLVAVVIASMKFLEGAWIVVLLIPLLVLLFLGIRRHYLFVERERTSTLPVHLSAIQHRFVVPIAHLDGATIQSLAYARSLSSRVTAVHVALDDEEAERVRSDWERWEQTLKKDEATNLLIIESPYRTLIRPLLAYVDTLRENHPEAIISVVLPEFVVAHWWEYLLHNQTALRLKAALLFRSGIVVIDVPVHPGSQRAHNTQRVSG